MRFDLHRWWRVFKFVEFDDLLASVHFSIEELSLLPKSGVDRDSDCH